MSSKRLGFFSLFIFVILFLGHFLGWLNFPENILRKLEGGLSGGFHSLSQSVENFFYPWLNIRSLAVENKNCNDKIIQNSVDRAELSQLIEENNLLRAQLNFLKTKNKFITANVIGKTSDLSENVIILDKGTKTGVQIGKPVIVGDGILIGKVVKVNPENSLVRLLIDSQSKVSVSVLNKNQTIGVVGGDYNLSLKLEMVPLTEIISINDQLITSGLEENLPRGLLIGKVETIEKELYQPFQKGEVKSETDLSKLFIVSVLIE